MNKRLLLLLVAACSIFGANAQSSKQNNGGPAWASTNKGDGAKGSTDGQGWAWTVQPFDHKIFIENQGQFDQLVNKKNKVLFGTQLGDELFAYFTPNGVIYRKIVYPKLQAAKKDMKENSNYDPDKEVVKPIITFLASQWIGSNPNVTVDAQEERPDYYIYPTGKSSSVQVNVFRKIVYKNLYPGIDAEYTFLKDKQGFKYALIVHPGADLSKVKLKYQGDKGMSIDANGDVTIKSDVDDIVDHAPVSNYQEGGNLNSSYTLNGEEETFNAGSYDNTKTLVIDPWTWTSSPGLATNKAYDLDYDKAGNVYVYGSFSTWELAKFTSAGVLLWTYNATPISTGYYGDFACDKLSGKCYLTEGFDASGMQAIEVSTAGAQLNLTKCVANLQEGWRDVWDPCKDIVIIGGGSWQTTCDAGGSLDTNDNITPVNVLNENAAEEGHDMALTCVDPNGTQCYMASTQSAGDPGNFNNVMIQLPVPALAPAAYQTATGYVFQESSVAQYVAAFTANGLNGMAASPNWLYIYDGAKLKRVNKGTGAIITTVVVTATSEDWGGLDVDNCDNVYVGENSAVQVYNSALALTTTYATSNTVYDVVLGTNFQTLYACGNGFLSSMPLPAPSYTINKTRTNASCGCTGTASAQLVACGTPVVAGLTYAWSSGQTTSSVTALCAGTYTITITQAGCPTNVYTDTVLIKNVGGGGPTLTTTQVNVKCNGGATGSATVTAAGGTLPYTYAWTPSGGTSATASNLTAGTYTITVKDANGCSTTAAVTITQPTALTATTTVVPVKCNGGATGSSTVTAGGGTPAYLYSWTPGGNTNANATGLTAGTYTVTVTDANGCTITATSIITQPPALTATTTVVPVKCNGGATGSTTVTAGGGTPAYTYAWAPGGQTTAAITGLSAGTYTITVKDANGCSITATSIITQPPVLTATTTVIPVKCNGGATGSSTVTAGGGTPAYLYSWAPGGQTNATATNLTAGTYTVTVTDANGCTITATSIITQPPVLTATTTNTPVLCNGGATGSATVTAGGGTPAYIYTWAPGGNTNANATGLTAGTYTVTVKDANGCTITATATITQPPALTATTTNTPVKCNGGATGSATVTAGGGTPAYLYSWAPGGNTNANATGLTAGTYTVTVTDANGCTITATATITQPPALTATTTTTTATCGGSNGSATVTAGGGTPAYTYTWAPVVGTNALLTGLSAGSYTVTVKDANGCSITASVIVANAAAETVTVTGSTNILCNGGANGSITTNTVGGTAPYTYAWTPVGGTGANATGLTAGCYTVTVKDANGCVSTASACLTQPTALTATTTVIPVKCNAGNTGSATVTAGGGTPAYIYTWAPGGQTNATATNLTAGTYTVTVKDANGCTITATAIITQPPVLTATTTNTPVKCNGGNTGSATVTAGGGTPAYLYSWAPGGQTNANATNLTAGTYTVTVTDANGCTITATATITQPTALTAATTNTTATCGQSNGSVTVTAGGGTPAYVYAWAPGGATTANVTGLSANTYTVTVTDANGCTITATSTVANAAAEVVTISGSTNILCNGGNNGSITTTTAGGTAPYTYAWTPVGGTGANATGLTAGCYTVTVKDANGCVSTASACLTQPTALTATTTTTPVKCNAGNTGSATVTAGGGTGAYTYAWAPGGQTNANATNLTAGTYTVTVKDANGCSITATAIVTQPTALTATTTIIPVKCNAGNTGSATVTAGGGTPAYAYAWAPGGQTNANATSLTAGTYTVTVTDANGCTITATAIITQPTALTATTTNTTATCGQSNGSVTVTAGGGTPGYLYSWTPSGATTANVTGLSANTYTVTVTDANGCTITATSTIANAAAEVVTISGSTNILCNGGNNGSITTNTVGGTPPYNYAWTPSGQTGANATGLTAGCYTVTVHDANGCTSTASACLTQPTALTATTTTSPVLCNAGNTGSATVTAGGGTPAYAYAWAPGGQTNANATNLTAGTYTVTVTDANGCTITATAIVTQPSALTVTTGGIVEVLCNGGNNASATATAGGGTPAYNYSWSNGQTGTNATGLTAGTYTVTATDANGCSITATAVITEPTALTTTTTTVQSTCGNPNGSATATGAGGTPAYNYSWSNGQSGANATGLTAGTYTVITTDANGCTFSTTAIVPNAAAETVTISGTTNILCNGGNNGSITTNTTGGTLPYTYLWTPSGQTGANATGLTAGTYTVAVKDANGCNSTASATLTQPTALTATTTTSPVLCNAGNTGSATVTAGGGTGAYTYSWAPGGQTTDPAANLTACIYTVTVTDANGCIITATATVTQPTALTVTTGGIVNVLCNGGSNASAIATAGGGTPAYTYAWSNGQSGANATGLTAGTYTVTATDANGCSITATATITQPTSLTATTTTTSSTCGNPNGKATVTGANGTPAYTYAWSNGQTGANASGLSAATYTVTTTDANGCVFTTTAVVNNIPGETVSINPPVNVLCFGGNNASATSVVVGGTAPYTYNWTPTAQTNATASGLTAGTYTVNVQDANGCLSSASVTITQPTLLTVATGPATNDLCNGDANGSDLATAAGGTGAYTYTWTPGGQTNANATGLTAGTYTIQVTDANGCTATATTTITQPPVLTLTAAGFPVTCNLGSDGQATAIPGGGTPPYVYSWSNGSTAANNNNLTAGNYTITITDAHGCTHDTTVTVTQPPPIVVAFTADTINGCAPLCTGFKDGSTDPGGTIVHWSWSYSDGGKDTVQNPRHCFTSPGSYSVTLTVVDNHGCNSTLTIVNMITVYTAPVAAFDFGPQPTTIVNPVINFTDKSTDAYGIARWLWNFNDPLNDVPSTVQNPTHTYGDTGTFCASLVVTNIHGCTDSVTHCLIIGPQYELFIPNAFTPNGDGKNETFQPKGEFVKDYKMYIFDRWGMLIFYTDDFNKGWPGTVNGGSRICQEDTYVYLIEATDDEGTQHRYIGKVSLLK